MAFVGCVVSFGFVRFGFSLKASFQETVVQSKLVWLIYISFSLSENRVLKNRVLKFENKNRVLIVSEKSGAKIRGRTLAEKSSK